MNKNISVLILVLFVCIVSLYSAFESNSKKKEPKTTETVDLKTPAGDGAQVSLAQGNQKHATPIKPKPKVAKTAGFSKVEALANSAKTGEVPIPVDAVLETGDGASHSMDLQVFLATREERRRRIAEHLEAVMVKESADPQWEEQLSSQAEEALAQITNLEGITISNTNCGDSVCRLTINADNSNVHGQLRGMSSAIGLILGSDSWTKSDKTELVSEVYISRPGEQLPVIGE